MKAEVKDVQEDGSVLCGNCGKPIPPNTAVSVMTDGNKAVIFHAEYNCSTAGNARYGWWGDGKLNDCFDGIEQC